MPFHIGRVKDLKGSRQERLNDALNDREAVDAIKEVYGLDDARAREVWRKFVGAVSRIERKMEKEGGGRRGIELRTARKKRAAAMGEMKESG
jgi:hypothetical protein